MITPGVCVVERAVFINYRGEDSHSYGALLYNELTGRFGSDLVFLDCESIPAGVDFAAELLTRVRSARVLLAVIGSHWLTATGPTGRRRIDDPADWIRRELAEAFAAGVRVIPVLTDQAELPHQTDLPADIAALSRCQSRRLRHREPSADLARIVADLTSIDPVLATAAARRRNALRLKPVYVIGAVTEAELRGMLGVETGRQIESWHQPKPAFPADLPTTTVIDPDAPSIARMYDYVLGGALNFRCDREAARQVLRIMPGYRDHAAANRAFLHRGVRAMMESGIAQFLELGSGLPTVSPVHEVAHQIDPTSRVVYVDKDPIAVAHSRLIVGDDRRLGVVETDMLDVDSVLDAPETHRVLDPGRPIGLLMVGVLHFVSDCDQITRVMAAYHQRLVAGSTLLASHASDDDLRPEVTVAALNYFASLGIHLTPRSRDEFRALIGPWHLTADGVVDMTRWRAEGVAEPDHRSSLGYALMADHVSR